MHQALIDTELVRPDGTVLRGWVREPGAARPGRSIWIVHGLGEHLGRYEEFAEWLLERGWTVGGHDHRGHGRSDGRHGVIQRRDDLVSDLEAGLERFTRERGGTPLLFGQSLGGLVALLLALRSPERIRGLVLSSPALDPGLTRLQRVLQQALLWFAPDLPVPTGRSPEQLSNDPEVARRWREDPLVHGRISARLLDFVTSGSRQALHGARRLAVPTLLQFGTEDRFVEPRGSRRLGYAAPRDVLTVIEYPWLRHELHHEPAALREPVREDLERWLARFA
jgi:alpha-beta hydrolase superfamily lysophospholipase